jgi:hypothetical protein
MKQELDTEEVKGAFPEEGAARLRAKKRFLQGV